MATAVIYTVQFRCPGSYGCDLVAKSDAGSPQCAVRWFSDCIFQRLVQARLRVDVLADKPSVARLFRARQHGDGFAAPSSQALDHALAFDQQQQQPAKIMLAGRMPQPPPSLLSKTRRKRRSPQ